MKLLKRLFSITALLTLAACGGGGGSSGTPAFGAGASAPLGGGGTTSFAALDLQLSQPAVPNTGAESATATVTALDANRVAVAGVPVTISANNGAIVSLQGTAGAVTDTSGKLVATIGIGSDRSNRDITITATAGSVTASAVLKVISAATGTAPTSIELIAASTSVGTGGDGVLIRAFVKDANNNTMPNAPVSFNTSSGTLSNVSATTDASGVATATLSAGASKNNRNAEITVTSGTVTEKLTLPIGGTKLTLSGPSSLVRNTNAAFDITVTDSKGNVVPNVAVTAKSSLNNPVVAAPTNITNSSGVARFTYTATTPGTDTLSFTAAGVTASPSMPLVVIGQNFAFLSPTASSTVPVNTQQTVRVQIQGYAPLAGIVIDFAATGGTLTSVSTGQVVSQAATDGDGIASVNVSSRSAGPVTVQATVSGSNISTTIPLVIVATVPSKLVLQVTPTALAPNLGTGTANQAQVIARLTDAEGNPVQGETVNFTRVSDPSGGNLLQASSVTDASGQASVAYRSGAESTANNGVVLSATAARFTAVTGTAALTVNQTALFIALGTGNVIENLDPQTYKKDWVVYVTDSNGVPVNGVTLTIKAIPTAYLT
ncbi:MAG: Ig-like domain-containing protein, partial [Pseudomonadota bacterium]|nr:Ig-like domain-containing protein [Pseudomonadota bacterium]